MSSVSTSRPLLTAPTMTASSREPTRIAAPRRVSSSWRPDSRVRRWTIAISSGSHTTYAPWIAQPTRKVVKDGANASHHEPSAVTAVETSRTRLWPERSPSRASNGMQRALTMSCAASNQLMSPSLIER